MVAVNEMHVSCCAIYRWHCINVAIRAHMYVQYIYVYCIHTVYTIDVSLCDFSVQMRNMNGLGSGRSAAHELKLRIRSKSWAYMPIYIFYKKYFIGFDIVF